MNMSQIFENGLLGWFTTENLLLLIGGLVIVAATFIADKLIRRAISRYSRRVRLHEHVANILQLVSRIIVVASGVVALFQLFGVSTEWFIGVSALAGTAIGFASTQTIGNFLAGLYVMISRPFLVRDYVRIGSVEGEVREININYTKIYTPTYNLVEIPNRKILDSTILNYSKGDIVDYTFEIGFAHDLTNQELINQCITPAIEEWYEKHKDVLPKKPQFSMSKIDRLERRFQIRTFFPEGKMDTFYGIQPMLMQSIMERWDRYKKQKA